MALGMYQTSTPHSPKETCIRGACRFLFREKSYHKTFNDYGYRSNWLSTHSIYDIVDKNYNCINSWRDMGITKAGYLLKHDGYSYSVETSLFEIAGMPTTAVTYELAICTQSNNSKIDTLYTNVYKSTFNHQQSNVTNQVSWEAIFELGWIMNRFKGE